MYIEEIELRNFRNIKQASVKLSPHVNLIYGNNAQGKTNLLEAVYYFARGKSFRGVSDGELRHWESEGFTVSLRFQSEGKEKSLCYRTYGKEKKKYKNGVEEEKLIDMIGHFRAVLFFPEHLNLVKEGPSGRREFLNVAIGQLKPSYLSAYGEYNKILENRNAILKNAQKGWYWDEEQFWIWSEALAARAAYLHKKRVEYVEKIEGYAKGILAEISSGKEVLSLSYESDIAEGEELIEGYRRLFSEHKEREILNGCSLYGIHRDDLNIQINGMSAKTYASQGQQRSIVLALKLAEGEVSRELCGEYPVFLLDDVFSELDATRKKYLLSGKEEKQMIITACESSEWEDCEVHRIFTEKGNYVSSYRKR